ncbi:MAG: RNA polymerase sigma factor [Chloroflexi bacterium]|nr:RNA polymerase sigma factor [Chloroflexota bacterium]
MLQQCEAMYSSPSIHEHGLETMLLSERSWLVRFCAHLTGNADSAEDLAQETLLEAWRNQQKLSRQVDQEGIAKWLTAIARNVCLRWMRRHGRDRAHITSFTRSAANEEEANIANLPAQDGDIEIELERGELVELLDRALALLPSETREVLIERFVYDSPYAEIARRLQVSEGSLMQRIYRGKLTLRQVITTQMREEAAAYGLLSSEEEKMHQETRIWCPMCSKARLIKYFHPQLLWTGFTCPQCWHIAAHPNAQLWAGLHSPKAILARQLAALEKRYWSAINTLQGTCETCGSLLHVRIYRPQDIPPERYLTGGELYHGVSLRCSICGDEDINSLPHLMLDTPEAQRFYRKHPRIHWRPGQEIDYQSQPALVGSFQDVSDHAILTIICQRETLKVLGTYESFH